MTVAAPRLAAEHLSVHFDQRSALADVTCAFVAGESVSLVGPNGAGKSTLLRALAGLQPPTHGRVLLDGEPLRGPSRRIVYVPQRSGVDWSFPLSVLDVASMGLGLRRTRFRPLTSTDRATALAGLEQVGMAGLARVQIGQLSGGQQQRVFLARAITQGGAVYLLDEPFAGIDLPTQDLLFRIFGELRATGKTIITATHDLASVAASASRVLVIRQRLIADGPPATTLTAENLVAAFGGQAIVPSMLTAAG